MSKLDLFIHTQASSLSRAIVAGLNNVTTPKALPAMVLGGERQFNLYLLNSSGTYDSRSGDASYTPRLGAGPIGGVATGGTTTLTDGTDTTAAIVATAAATDLQTALNALNAAAGPDSGTVTVSRPAVGTFIVDWDAFGARTLLSAVANKLTPESGVVVNRTRIGDGTTKEQQTIRFARQPAIYSEGLTTIANGWSGTLSANNARVLQLLAGGASVTTDFEIEIEGPSGPPEVVAESTISIRNEIINPASLAGAGLPTAVLSSNLQLLPGITGLTGGASTDLDAVATTELNLGTIAIIGATVSASIPGVMWQLKSDAARPAEGGTVVHTDDHSEKYWSLLGSGS